jgi:hypothetical protein
VLLWTLSRPGSYGVNIQGTSTIVKADRDRLVSLFGKTPTRSIPRFGRKAEALGQVTPPPAAEPVSSMPIRCGISI